MQILEEYLLDSAMLEPHTKIVDSRRKLAWITSLKFVLDYKLCKRDCSKPDIIVALGPRTLAGKAGPATQFELPANKYSTSW